MRKLLLGFALSFSLLGLNVDFTTTKTETLEFLSANTAHSQVLPYGHPDSAPDAPDGFCQGTGSVITYNTMPWSSEWYYITTHDWISFGELNLPLSDPNSCLILGGCGAFPSQDNDCVLAKVNDDRIKESEFIAGRKCSTSNCNNNDPIKSYVKEPTNNNLHPEYKLSITEAVSDGDTIRALIYVHNTATENQHSTTETNVIINWNETDKTISSYVEFSNQSGVSQPNSTTATLDIPNLGANLKLIPTSLSRLNSRGVNTAYEVSNLTPNETTFIVDNLAKTAIHRLESHNSSLSNRKYIYVDFLVESTPEFEVNKTADPAAGAFVNAGDEITYTISVENTGDVPLTDVVVTDVLDDNVSFIGTAPGSTGITFNPSNNTVSLDFGDLAFEETKELSFIVQIDNPLSDQVTEVCNLADSVEGFSAEADGTIIFSDLCHFIALPIPEFEVNKTADPAAETFVNAGDEITYTISVENTGDVPLTDVVITDVLDDNLSFIGSAPGSTGITFNPSNNTVSLNFGDLAFEETKELSFIVQIDNPLSDQVTEVCNLADSVEGISAEAEGTIIFSDLCHLIDATGGGNNPEFEVNKTSQPAPDSQLDLGDNITYTISVENTGDVPLSNLVVTDILDPNLIYIGPTTGSTGLTFTSSNNTVTLNFGTLAPAATASKSFTVQVANPLNVDATQVCNRNANVAGIANYGLIIPLPSVNGNNVFSDLCHFIGNIFVPDPSFSIEKKSNPLPGTELNPGSNITYTLRVTNTGNVPLENITVTDALDPNVTFVSGGSGVNHANGVISININTLGIGTFSSYVFTVSVNDNVTDGTNVCNNPSQINGSVMYLGTNIAGLYLTGDICHPISVTPLPLPKFTIRKAADPIAGTSVIPGENITYSFIIENTGNVDLNDIVITDILDPNLTFVSGGINVSAVDGIVSIEVDNLGVGTSVLRSFIVSVNNNVPNGTNVCNNPDQISNIGDYFNGDIEGFYLTGDLCHPVSVDPQPTPKFTIRKSSNPINGTEVIPGQPITYTLSVINTGEIDLTNVVVTDFLDTNLTYIGTDPANNLYINYNLGTNIVSLNYETLAIGETKNLSFIVEVNDPVFPETIEVCNERNDIFGSSDQTNGLNQVTDICHPLSQASEPQYTITKTDNLLAGADYALGAEFQYIITVANTGNVNIPTIIATDVLPNTLTYISPSAANPFINHDPSTNTVTLRFINIGIEESSSLSFTVKLNDNAQACTEICNTVNSNIQTMTPGMPAGRAQPVPAQNRADAGVITTVNNGVQNMWNSTRNFASELLSSVLGNPATSIPAPPIIAPVSNSITSASFCREVECNGGSGGYTVSKRSSPQDGANVQAGDIITYFIDVTNNSTQTLSEIVVTDELDANLIFGATTTPAQVTEISPGIIKLTFGDIAAFGTATLSFDVTVGGAVVDGSQVCNTATFTTNGTQQSTNEVCHTIGAPFCGNGFQETGEQCDDGNLINGDGCSNQCTIETGNQFCGNGIVETGEQCDDGNLINGDGCRNNCTTGGGGGGGEVIPSIGVCADAGNGSFMCSGRKPDRSQGILWTEWNECRDNGGTEDDCLDQWAAAAGFNTRCDTSGSTVDLANQCDVIIDPPKDPEFCYVNGCANLVGRVEKTAINDHVAVNENAQYNVKVWLRNDSQQDVNITLSELRIYDLSIPAESGWVWNHVLIDPSREQNWKLVSDGTGINYFEFQNPSSITISANSEKEVSRNLKYYMNTALTVKADTSQVSNVAFATMKFTTSEVNSNSQLVTKEWDLRLDTSEYKLSQKTSLELCPTPTISEFFGAGSTLGSTAKVTIKRPFVQVRTGGDLGIQNYTPANNPFGGYQQGGLHDGKNSGERISIDENLFQGFFEEFAETAISATPPQQFFSKSFTTTNANSNVWFYDGKQGDVTIDAININQSTNILNDPLSGSKTFIIREGNLIINNNFNLKNFAAFVVEDGNIIIDPGVEAIEGMFITPNGRILSAGDEKAREQLSISGAIMGDATDLLQDRVYIGEFVPKDINNPKGAQVLDNNGLQPSVKINYDLRLLTDTPPALEAFLGEGSVWGQEF